MRSVEQTSDKGGIIADEQRILSRVSTALSRLNVEQTGAPAYDDALVDLRDQIAEAKPEDLAPLVEQMSRIASIAQRYGRGRDLPVDPASPYFAHLQLVEDGQARDVLIGKHGFIDRGQEVQIVDWRDAPVSRIYYRYEEGDDYEEQFGPRTAEGTISARRTLTIMEAQLNRISCPQGLLVADAEGNWFDSERERPLELRGGQGKALRPPVVQRATKQSRLGARSALHLRADKHLPEIAALIDPTQFDLITQPDSGLVVLQGGAGTGKTTVALHRVAYLSYQAPNRFRPEKMLVVVPGEAMVHYIERVLPELGVGGVQVTTNTAWFERTRRRVLPNAPSGKNDDTPSVVLRFKKHPLMLTLAQHQVAAQVEQAGAQLTAVVAEAGGADEVLNKWRGLAKEPLARRLKTLRSWVHRQERLAAATRQAIDSALRQLARRARDLMLDWAEMLTDNAMLTALVAEQCPNEFRARDLKEIAEWCARQSEEVDPLDDEDEDEDDDRLRSYMSVDGRDERVQAVAGRLDPPDSGLLLYLALLKWGDLPLGKGKKRRVSYEHVVVDEAQDLTVVELKVLLAAAGEQRSVTLAGDTAQRVVFDNAFEDWAMLLRWLDVPVTSNTTLRLGYRSTAEVMALAQRFVDGSGDGPLSTRHGSPVEMLRFGEQGEAVATLADALRSLMMREPLASVALITRYPGQAKAYADALYRAEVPAVRWVRSQGFSFRPGIEVTDVGQVKGLEFDYVILLDVTPANYPRTLESRHLLHIAATRAVHQLWIVTVGQLSLLLPEA